MRGACRTLSERQDDPSGSHADGGRPDPAQRERARGQYGRRRLAGIPRTGNEHRDQRREFRLSQRSLDGPGLPRLGRVPAGHPPCADGRRYRRGGLRTLGRQGDDDGTGPEIPRRPRNSALPVPQQDRPYGRDHRPGDDGGPAGRLRQAAGAAPCADRQRRGDHRLCRSGERTGLRVSGRQRIEADPGPVRHGGRWRAGPAGNARIPGGFRRRSAGTAARRRHSAQGRGLRLPDRDPAVGQHRAGVYRLGPERRRNPAAAQGATPRSARRGVGPRAA